MTDEQRRSLKHGVIDYHYDVAGYSVVYASFYITDTDRCSGAHVMMKRSVEALEDAIRFGTREPRACVRAVWQRKRNNDRGSSWHRLRAGYVVICSLVSAGRRCPGVDCSYRSALIRLRTSNTWCAIVQALSPPPPDLGVRFLRQPDWHTLRSSAFVELSNIEMLLRQSVLQLIHRCNHTSELRQAFQPADAGIARVGLLCLVVNQKMAMVGAHRNDAVCPSGRGPAALLPT